MSVAIPMVNQPNLYVDDLFMSWVSTTVLDVSTGACRNSTNVNDIILPSIVSVTTTVKGAGGIDTGTVAINTLYDVYVIGDSFGYNTGSALFALATASAPVLPLGYDMWRRVGCVLTDGSSHFLKFTQNGNGLNRTMWYDAGISELSGGTSATYADVDLSDAMPISSLGLIAILNAALTPTGNGDVAHLQPKGATDAGGYVTIGGSAGGTAFNTNVYCPTSAAAIIQYKVTGALTLLLRGYVDSL